MPVEIRHPAPGTLPSPGGEGQGEGGTAVPDFQGEGGTAVPDFQGEGGPSVLDFISSDETLDRYDEIISASGWRLDTYRLNPVFQNAHQYGDIIFTLGKALITEIRTREAPGPLSTINHSPSTFLYQRIQFAVDANPMARLAYKLYQGGFLKAVSVGFIPLRWQDANGHEHTTPSVSLSSAGGEGRGEEAFKLSTINSQRSTSPGCRRKYLKQELLEVSAVSIPANPNALALAFKSGAVEKSDLRDVADLCAHTLSAASPSLPKEERVGERRPFSSQLETIHYQQLTATARLITHLLKH